MTKIIGTTTTGIIFSDASPMKPGERIVEYIERLIEETEKNKTEGHIAHSGTSQEDYITKKGANQ